MFGGHTQNSHAGVLVKSTPNSSYMVKDGPPGWFIKSLVSSASVMANKAPAIPPSPALNDTDPAAAPAWEASPFGSGFSAHKG